jgi:iodotyrosine deiodinase
VYQESNVVHFGIGLMANYPFIPYKMKSLPEQVMIARGQDLYREMSSRRSVRHFSSKPIPRECIELAIRIAATAPSGANCQPWRFVAVDDDGIKRQIREAAETEERISYEGGRMPPEWLQALAPLGTDWHKPFLETVPWIVVVFEEIYQLGPEGQRLKSYYAKESVGIACGLFIVALHVMGLATLTHTPSPMAFLSKILGRPENERPFILFPVGYPADDATVPDLTRKSLDEVAVWDAPTLMTNPPR